MTKRLLYAGIGVWLVFLLIFGIYKLMNSRTYQLFGELTSEVETNQKVVALTFDDGPTENVDKLLPLLENHNVKATFFLIGEDIKKNPQEAEKLVKAGHQIGNHTYSHERMVFKKASYIREEIEKTDELIKTVGYQGPIYFRPPNGKKLVGLPYVLNKENRETVMWNIEPDSHFGTPSEKIKYAMENAKPGSIILMHPMYDDTGEELEAIEGIIKGLTEKGYSFVTVSELKKQTK